MTLSHTEWGTGKKIRIVLYDHSLWSSILHNAVQLAVYTVCVGDAFINVVMNSLKKQANHVTSYGDVL